MKIKDIENELKKEHSEAKVPDVYARVKKAPINRLLSPPSQVFQKKVATRLLALSFVLLLVVIFTLITMWSVPPKTQGAMAYVNIDITSAEGNVRYGLIVCGGDVYCAYIERQNGEDKHSALSVPTDVKNAIYQVYQAKNSDEVYVMVVCNDTNEKTRVVEAVRDALQSLVAEASGCSVSICVDNAQGNAHLEEYVQAHGGESDGTIDGLLQEYIKLTVD